MIVVLTKKDKGNNVEWNGWGGVALPYSSFNGWTKKELFGRRRMRLISTQVVPELLCS